MTLPSLYVCQFCKKEISPNATGVWRKVEGWVQNRKAGGANAVALAEPLPGFACNYCIGLARTGKNNDQGSLFD